MGFADLVLKNRSYRRFFENRPIDEDFLRNLVALARITPASANRQPLRYILLADPEKNALIFETLVWAGYLKDWPGPSAGERPAAYIVVCGDREVCRDWSVDPGIVMQTMLLGAAEKGVGGCMFGSVRRDELAGRLKLSDRYEIVNVVAFGYPREEVMLEDTGPEGDIRYYRDDAGVHHVPKRSLDELILD